MNLGGERERNFCTERTNSISGRGMRVFDSAVHSGVMAGPRVGVM